jgi:hypothetical protein
MTSAGSLSFLKDPEIDAWYAQQAVELDAKKREAVLAQDPAEGLR